MRGEREGCVGGKGEGCEGSVEVYTILNLILLLRGEYSVPLH